jgi:hypothetical protein
MYLSRKLTTRSLPEIGRRFGGRDHTTVLHACLRIEALIVEDALFRQEVDFLSQMLQRRPEISTRFRGPKKPVFSGPKTRGNLGFSACFFWLKPGFSAMVSALSLGIRRGSPKHKLDTRKTGVFGSLTGTGKRIS